MVPDNAPPSCPARPGSVTRRAVLGAGAAGLLAAPVAVRAAGRQPADDPAPGTGLPEGYPSTPPSRAREIVGASHANIDRVRELVAVDPSLARASYDWGFGDWETAIGAASHTGRRDIAELLISSGARPTLFTFAMLDQVEVVRAYCEANPGIQGLHGPHGITLLAHGRAGDASRVIEYLEALGGADQPATSLGVSDAEIERYLGRYDFGPGEADHWVVARSRRGDLTLQRADDTPRVLRRTGDHTFSPAGAQHVTVTFEMAEDRAAAVVIHGAGRVLEAARA